MESKEVKQEEQNVAGFFSFGMNKKENTPIFASSKAAWINYGDDNDYGGYLVELMNTSSKHNSLIKKKVNMTAGSGFKENTALKDFYDNIHGKEDLNTIAFKQAYDLMTYGGYSMAVTWSKDKTEIVRETFIDHSKVRLAKTFEEDDINRKLQDDGVEFYYTSSDWTQYRKDAHKPILWQGFSEKHKEQATQLISVNEYRTGVDYYTYPDYISSVDWIELDKEIANFHLSSVHNGFTPSMIISFRGGVPTIEAQKAVKKNLKKQYGGSDNGSEVFVTFSESADKSPEFIPVNLNASDERFIQLEEQIQQNIIIAHGASPIIAGIAISGKLGSSDEVRESEEMFQNNVIDAKQKLIERTYNKILKINGSTETVELLGIKSFEDITEDIIEDGTPVDVEAEAKANLRGSVGGVTGILDIAAKVTAGTISRDAGQSILEIIFGLTPEDSTRLLGGVEEDKTIEDANK